VIVSFGDCLPRRLCLSASFPSPGTGNQLQCKVPRRLAWACARARACVRARCRDEGLAHAPSRISTHALMCRVCMHVCMAGRSVAAGSAASGRPVLDIFQPKHSVAVRRRRRRSRARRSRCRCSSPRTRCWGRGWGCWCRQRCGVAAGTGENVSIPVAEAVLRFRNQWFSCW